MTRAADKDAKFGLATRAVHAGQEPEPLAGAVTLPIFQTSTYVQEAIGKNKGFDYARTINPTRQALERNVASLEGGRHGFAFSSGMGAIHTILTLLSSGDHVVCGENVYGGTHRLMDKILTRLGLTFSFVDTREIENVERAITPKTKLLFAETPTNPLTDVCDIAALAQLAHDAGALDPKGRADVRFAPDTLKNENPTR